MRGSRFTAVLLVLGLAVLTPQAWAATCGDGILESGESCDDGNLTDSDGCSASCQIEAPPTTTTTTTVPVCGNGTLESGEGCDDGNVADGDCCNSSCQLATEGDPCADDGFSCTSDSCDATGTCQHQGDDQVCDDGWWCNGAEVCDSGSGCQAGTSPDCNDGISCTVDACNERADVCVSMPAHYLCSDGLFCNGSEICDTTSGCVDGTDIDCSSLDNGCRDPWCDEDSDSCQAISTNAGLACDHIDICVSDAICTEGACFGTAAAQTETKVGVRFARGADNDSLGFKTMVAPADMPGVSCVTPVTIALAADDGTAIYSGTLPTGKLERQVDDSHCRYKASKTESVAGLRKLGFKYLRNKGHYRVKAKMKGIEMPGGQDKTGVMLSLIFGEAATGSCVTAKDMTCKARERSIKCKMPPAAPSS